MVHMESIKDIMMPLMVQGVVDLIKTLEGVRKDDLGNQVPVEIHHHLSLFSFEIIAIALFREDLQFIRERAPRLAHIFSLAMVKDIANARVEKDVEFQRCMQEIDSFVVDVVSRHKEKQKSHARTAISTSGSCPVAHDGANSDQAFLSLVLAKNEKGEEIFSPSLQRSNCHVFGGRIWNHC